MEDGPVHHHEEEAFSARTEAATAHIERAVFFLRSVPTALLFHTIAHVLRITLLAQNPPEKAAAQALHRHYLTSCTPREANDLFGVQSWPG